MEASSDKDGEVEDGAGGACADARQTCAGDTVANHTTAAAILADLVAATIADFNAARDAADATVAELEAQLQTAREHAACCSPSAPARAPLRMAAVGVEFRGCVPTWQQSSVCSFTTVKRPPPRARPPPPQPASARSSS